MLGTAWPRRIECKHTYPTTRATTLPHARASERARHSLASASHRRNAGRARASTPGAPREASKPAPKPSHYKARRVPSQERHCRGLIRLVYLNLGHSLRPAELTFFLHVDRTALRDERRAGAGGVRGAHAAPARAPAAGGGPRHRGGAAPGATTGGATVAADLEPRAVGHSARAAGGPGVRLAGEHIPKGEVRLLPAGGGERLRDALARLRPGPFRPRSAGGLPGHLVGDHRLEGERERARGGAARVWRGRGSGVARPEAGPPSRGAFNAARTTRSTSSRRATSKCPKHLLPGSFLDVRCVAPVCRTPDGRAPSGPPSSCARDDCAVPGVAAAVRARTPAACYIHL